MIHALLVKVSFLILLSGCKISTSTKINFLKEFQVVPHTYVKDIQIHEIMMDFLKDVDDVAPKNILNKNLKKLVSYRFESLMSIDYNNNIAGYCANYITGYRELVIDVNLLFYKELLRAVIYHELGHCLLNLPHNDDYINLMNSYINVSNEYYKDNWNLEIEKLKFIIMEHTKK